MNTKFYIIVVKPKGKRTLAEKEFCIIRLFMNKK